MNIDFFIHPEHPINTGYPHIQVYRRYFDHLNQVLEGSEFPVIISGSFEGKFIDRFPLEQRIESASYFICDCPVDLGEVSPSGWEQFTALADRGDSYRVHGSFFGQCTEGFAVQLFAYIKRREHWHNWRAAVDKEGAACQDKLRGQHEYAGDFKNSNIRFGVVLAPTEPIKIARPSLISTLCKKPHGNITYQLMDDRTIVYQNI